MRTDYLLDPKSIPENGAAIVASMSHTALVQYVTDLLLTVRHAVQQAQLLERQLDAARADQRRKETRRSQFFNRVYAAATRLGVPKECRGAFTSKAIDLAIERVPKTRKEWALIYEDALAYIGVEQ